jgi:formylglycine-generating enzyme required for sulfatase activity
MKICLPAVSLAIVLSAGLAPLSALCESPALVLGAERPAESDLIRLKTGETLTARIANSEFKLHTAYGSIALPAHLIAAISFDQSPEHFDCVLGINRNRLTGFLNDPIEIEDATGQKRRFLKPDLELVLFRKRDTETNRMQTGQFALLANGDLLSGQVRLPPVQTKSPSGPQTIEPAALESILFSRPPPEVELAFANGEERSGMIESSSIRIVLDLGADLLLPRQMLRVLHLRRGFVPAEANAFFGASARTNLAGGQPPGVSIPANMAWIPPGKFIMGSPAHERGRNSDEDPQCEVTITRGFWMAKHEVTQEEYRAVMGANPSAFGGARNLPVEKVNWHEAGEYCARLTSEARARGQLPPGFVYRLPTEAEWEYACRAGTAARYSYGDDPQDLALVEFAWHVTNSDWGSHPVGQLKPNAWGLYDMHGNVWEWCLDLWSGAYPGGKLVDYHGPSEGWLRVARGGSWLYAASFCRSANRDDYGADNRCSDIGFRVVLAPPVLSGGPDR